MSRLGGKTFELPKCGREHILSLSCKPVERMFAMRWLYIISDQPPNLFFPANMVRADIWNDQNPLHAKDSRT